MVLLKVSLWQNHIKSVLTALINRIIIKNKIAQKKANDAKEESNSANGFVKKETNVGLQRQAIHIRVSL